ncbi:hypothetical protein JMA_10240 [Jeotgalibacillus malaysiensis]|uniref:HAD family hydrolase n=1 Tax=Jeotgalibacillus malaysiensis TaxID=1508404 RepID=A0A0B5AJZ5_9BACL|nr:hypothetical protein [Jeotgalibacillus malaysiensis]AJD90341.1 hypothetical protein JMA_10240 [Jeotgalibacillus malaysiensis]
MTIRAFFLDFYGTIVHEDGEIISNICNQIIAASEMDVTSTEIVDL